MKMIKLLIIVLMIANQITISALLEIISADILMTKTTDISVTMIMSHPGMTKDLLISRKIQDLILLISQTLFYLKRRHLKKQTNLLQNDTNLLKLLTDDC